MSILTIESNAIPFTVRIVQKGDVYGAKLALQYAEEEPIVEFYDARYKDEKRFTQYGQFVSSYYVSTLLESPTVKERGLNLDGGVPDWQIDSAAMIVVRRWLVDEIRRND